MHTDTLALLHTKTQKRIMQEAVSCTVKNVLFVELGTYRMLERGEVGRNAPRVAAAQSRGYQQFTDVSLLMVRKRGKYQDNG